MSPGKDETRACGYIYIDIYIYIYINICTYIYKNSISLKIACSRSNAN